MFSMSKCGLLISLIHVTITGLDIYSYLAMMFFGAIKKTNTVSAIVLSTKGFGLMILLLRRIVFVSDTVKCYNGLSEWPVNIPVRKSFKLILYTSAAAVFIEFTGDNFTKLMKDKPLDWHKLTAYVSLGFELQIIYTFHTVGQLYRDLNYYVEFSMIDDLERINRARQQNLALYSFCKKLNSHYSVDLIVHLSCYQLYIFYVLFRFVKRMSSSVTAENFINMKNVISIICLTRLFVVFIYLIESSSYLNHKSVFTYYYILRSRMNYLRYQTKEQIYLFLNELNATEVTITAYRCYDINKKFLYSVSGSIVAYLILIVSFLYER